jgi:hypothetical protein
MLSVFMLNVIILGAVAPNGHMDGWPDVEWPLGLARKCKTRVKVAGSDLA